MSTNILFVEITTNISNLKDFNVVFKLNVEITINLCCFNIIYINISFILTMCFMLNQHQFFMCVIIDN